MKVEEVLKFEDKIFEYIKSDLVRDFIEVEPGLAVRAVYNRKAEKLLNNEESKEESLYCFLLIHGYCSGIGMWSLNLDELNENIDIPFIAIDFPGFGLSSRFKYSQDSDECEKQLADNIEKLRKKLNVKHLIIAGHSFGAYISSLYAIHYPNEIKSLILIDPWGFSIRQPNEQPKLPPRKLPLWFRMIKPFISFAEPFNLLRILGPKYATNMIIKYRPDIFPSYITLFKEDTHEIISKYLFGINSMTPTGENAFHYLAAPMGWAKNPMNGRVDQFPKCDTFFINGANSWINQSVGSIFKENSQRDNINIKIIDNAGHHIYSDQFKTFNSHMISLLKLILKP